MHRVSGIGNPLCGRDSVTTDQLTQNNDEVTCGSCWQSMHASWGIALPSWVSPNMGGRKKAKMKKPSNKDIACSFCGKSKKDSTYLIQGPHKGLRHELPTVHICDDCVRICGETIQQNADIRTFLLSAKTDTEVNDGFDRIFDLVHETRRTGWLGDLEALLWWVQTKGVIQNLHTGLLLPCLRLTFTIKHHLKPWPSLLEAVEEELIRRGEDAERLLWGLDPND